MGPTGDGSVPLVNLSSFTSSKTADNVRLRGQAAKDLAEKLHANGYVGIIGHGVPAELLLMTSQTSSALFGHPYEEKMKAPHPKALYRIVVTLESYEIGSDKNLIQYNIWLPHDVLPGFREFTTKLFWELNKTTSAILDALIMSLDLTEKKLKLCEHCIPVTIVNFGYFTILLSLARCLSKEKASVVSAFIPIGGWFPPVFEDQPAVLTYLVAVLRRDSQVISQGD